MRMPWLERIVAREPRLPLRAWAGYPAAAVVVAAAYATRVALGSWLVGVPFITFFPAVMIAAVLGGLGPGLLATALSILLIWVFGFPPPLDTDWDWEQTGALATAIFGAASLLFCGV